MTPAHIVLLIWQILLVKANSVNISSEKELLWALTDLFRSLYFIIQVQN